MVFEEQYRLEEFKILRSEIVRYFQDMRAAERYAVLANAAIYGVLAFPKFGPADDTAVAIAWCLPPIIGFVALLRWRECWQTIALIAVYLQSKEPASSWENFRVSEGRKRQLTSGPYWYVAFWALLIGGTSAVGFFKLADGKSWQLWGAPIFGLTVAIASMAFAQRPR